MKPKTKKIITATIFILAGLFGAGCGGFFTFIFFQEALKYGEIMELLIISIPSFIGGLALIYLGYYFFKTKIKGEKSKIDINILPIFIVLLIFLLLCIILFNFF